LPVFRHPQSSIFKGDDLMTSKKLLIYGATLMVLGATAALPAQMILIDDFNDGNDDGWTHIDTTIGQK
jgi:hypothetical protein